MEPDEMLAALIAESGDRLLRVAYQLTHDRSSAEDVVQEALMTLYRSWLRRMPQIDNVNAYARRAVVNEYLRRRRLRSSSDITTSTPPEVVVSAGDDSVVERDAVWRALGSLPPRQRAVLVLRFYEDLADDRIAELIGAKESTVRSLAARALTALRAQSATVLRSPT